MLNFDSWMSLAPSIDEFVGKLSADYDKLDILVNNAAIAGSDGPPKACARSVMKTNYYGAVALAEGLLPLLQKSQEARLVNVASTGGKLLFLANDADRAAFSSESLTLLELNGFVEKFIADSEGDIPTIQEVLKAFSMPEKYVCYCYSKVALIAATKILARDPANANVLINSLCPGHCGTDINHYDNDRSPVEGAKEVLQLVLLPSGSTVNGRFYRDEADAEW